VPEVRLQPVFGDANLKELTAQAQMYMDSGVYSYACAIALW
jgi:hypothetical protein